MINNKDLEAEVGAEINGDVVFKNLDFTEKTIRHGFIRKVYGILMSQLALTLAFVAVFMYVDPVKGFVKEQGVATVLVAFLVMLIVIIIIHCSKSARRKSPANYIFLGIFTVAEGICLGIVSTFYNRNEMLIAVGICIVVTLGLTLFACQTKFDFTMLHTTLLTLLLIVCIVTTTAIFMPKDRLLHLAVTGLGVFVFSLLLIYDTQLIIGGKHSMAFSPEEYVAAALTLYLDIINLLLRILRIVQTC